MTAIIGRSPMVQVLNPDQRKLEQRARQLLEGKTVESVHLIGDQLVISMDDGAKFTMSCEGGFREVS